MTKQELIAQHNKQVMQNKEQEHDKKVGVFIDAFLIFAVAYFAFYTLNYLINL